MGKRKRGDDAQASEAPVSKKSVTENGLSAAEKRQQRSERKSKKVKPNKTDAKSQEPEQLLPGEDVGEDSFAGGEDFVSLNPDASTANPTIKNKSKDAKKAKSKASTAEEDAPTTTEFKPAPKQKESAARFIVFVGNLPYSTTTAQIAQHFKKLAPAHIRHNTDKQTGKSKGFAFLEFTDYSAMKTCLKVYHHSNFDPERTARLPESAFDEDGLEIGSKDTERKTGRRINVELTAGGGGKGSGRKEKIQKKNTKLFEERERRKKEEIKKGLKERKEKKSEVNSTEIGSEAVHPSRMRRVPNAHE